MEPTYSVEISADPVLAKFALLTKRTFPETLLRAGRGVVKKAMGITPPANQDSARGEGGGLTGEDYRRGQRAIDADLRRHFVPIRSKGVGPRGAMNPAEIHRDLFLRFKRPGKPLRRAQAAPYYVDRGKLLALRSELHRRVGRQAANWLPAARALDVKGVPAWVARHTGHGSFRADLSGDELYIEAGAAILPALHWELKRRLPYAYEYQMNAMKRELAHLLQSDGQKAGLHIV